ncbi:MAG: hypothetical protein R3B47_07760 [Bacteroidia bacterium]
MANLTIGTRVKHPTYGTGIVIDNSMEAAHIVVFKNHGEKAIAKDFEGIEIIELAPLPENRIGIGDLEQIMTGLLRKWGGITEVVHLGSRWKGGTMILQPADDSQKPKEIPIETFFHKIVMVRDRLRVLEQSINAHKELSDEDKVNIQQYITRIYGSLTTFNVLFASKEDQFKGEGKK